MDHDNLYQEFLESIPGLMVIDKKGQLVYISSQCANYIHVDKKQALGKDVNDVFPPSVMKKLLTGKKKYNTNFYFADGRVSFSSQAQVLHHGSVVGVIEYDMMQNIDSIDDFLQQYALSMETELKIYRNQLSKRQHTSYSINHILGTSPPIQQLHEQIERASKTNSTVIIQGETGTGKELVAHSIHNLSARTLHPFIKINSASLPPQLAESEFFGYAEGAFTGAKKGGKKGKFELANNGTLFIDEINQMPLELQPKLLRVLQEQEIDRVGGEENIPIDVRVIAATNQNLSNLILQGNFRQDLFYRLNVFPIVVPPLRDRLEDIPALVEYRIQKINRELNKEVHRVDPQVYEFMNHYSWPGNIRELNNMIERAMNYVEGDTLCLEHLHCDSEVSIPNLKTLAKCNNPIEEAKKAAERKLIIAALTMFKGNKTQTAKYLKISRPLLYQKITRLGIDPSTLPIQR